jgi:CheY-like chemotaxis protein
MNNRILIVEQDPATFEVLKRFLGNWLPNCDLVCVDNMTHASTKVQDGFYDVVVLGTTDKDDATSVGVKTSIFLRYCPDAKIILFSNLNLDLAKVRADEIVCRGMQESALASAIRRKLLKTQ